MALKTDEPETKRRLNQQYPAKADLPQMGLLTRALLAGIGRLRGRIYDHQRALKNPRQLSFDAIWKLAIPA
jgi:hypothetical protein